MNENEWMNESALGPKLSCTESVTENVKKERQKKTKRKKKERQLGLIKNKKEEGKKGDRTTYESCSRTE